MSRLEQLARIHGVRGVVPILRGRTELPANTADVAIHEVVGREPTASLTKCPSASLMETSSAAVCSSLMMMWAPRDHHG